MCDLVLSTLGALVDHARVRNIRAQAEVHSPAVSVTDRGVNDRGLDAKHGNIFGILGNLTLQLPTHGIPERQREREMLILQDKGCTASETLNVLSSLFSYLLV